jgi:hypothetical protein
MHVDLAKSNPRRINDLADLLYTSLQQRFSKMQHVEDDVEDLEESSGSQIANSEIDFVDEWK